jgi:malate dehydrogenase (oxaloacetate-decarboxylating)
MDISKKALALHKKARGKIRVASALKVKNASDLALIYTPGVAAISSHLAKHPKDAREYTVKGRMIAVVSDGSAVLGLGNIGPYGALPVMEGKCVIFKSFADIDAVPIVLNTQDPDEIVKTITAIAPTFGGINLEDFSAPNCFAIEERLKEQLQIPVMHDDQHGTAIVVTAGLINAAKVVKKTFSSLKVVILGAGAAGTAVAKLLVLAGVKDVIVVDSKGIIVQGREGISLQKRSLAMVTNPRMIAGDLRDALIGADAVIGVSGPKLLNAKDIACMAKKPIVFALANPIPEIMPADAKRAKAAVIATGRSDFPNQINNALVFPGVFRGALDNGVTAITDAMKLKAAKNLAALVPKPTAGKIIPGIFDTKVVKAVARAIR